MPKKKAIVYEKSIETLPAKARDAKREQDTKMAKHAQDHQRELYDKNNNQGTLSSIPYILDVKTLWETGVYTPAEIAIELGRPETVVKKVVSALNKTQFKSPKIRALAVEATKDILKNCDDDSLRMKMITKIFPDDQISQTNSGVSVNLNINPDTLAPKNPDFKHEDLDRY